MQQLDRKFIIHTGKAGMYAIDLYMKKSYLGISNKSLLDRGEITLDKYLKIKELIDAPGDDNLVMAEMIINFRENE